MRVILFITILSSVKLYAQIELPLTQLKVEQSGIEYDIKYIISGIDLTYLTTDYSSDSTRFYYNNELFSGIGTIYNQDQSTFITFQNGKLDGHWRDVMWSNNGALHEGYFKDGLKEGWWHSGSIELGPETNDGTEFKEIVLRRSEYAQGELIKEQYFERDWLTKLDNIEGYREISYYLGNAEDVHKYINSETFRGEKAAGPKNGSETYYTSKDSTTKEVLLFENGYIISKNRFKNDTLLHVDEYIINDEIYTIKRTNYYGNGNIKNQGLIITEFDTKSGEWRYYNIEGTLHKKEIYEGPFQPPITTHYDSDESMKKE